MYNFKTNTHYNFSILIIIIPLPLIKMEIKFQLGHPISVIAINIV